MGGLAIARAPVESKTGSVAWIGGLRDKVIPAYLPLGCEGEGRSRPCKCCWGGRQVGEPGRERRLTLHHEASKFSPLSLLDPFTWPGPALGAAAKPHSIL